MNTLRRPTNKYGSSGVVTPYTGCGLVRSCAKCLTHQQPTGGTISKRTGLWICRACKPQQKQP